MRPELKVLYTSGQAVTDGMAALFVNNSAFLPKPYTVEQLGTMLGLKFDFRSSAGPHAGDGTTELNGFNDKLLVAKRTSRSGGVWSALLTESRHRPLQSKNSICSGGSFSSHVLTPVSISVASA